jgi:hypothetical protein
MTKYFSLLIILLFNNPPVMDADLVRNEVYGEIKITKCEDWIVKGRGYNRDEIEFMRSDDPLVHPERNVIISMHPLDFKPVLKLTEGAYISQREQTFIPNILPIVVGSKVHFLNEDEYFHNVQSLDRGSRFSIGRRAPGISYSRKINKTGPVVISCDIHEHMQATILSFDTPYFCRLDEEGHYVIRDLPDGRYRLEVFHPVCPKITKEIKIEGGESFEFNFHISEKV